MRRITLKHAKPGMMVEAPVYDNWGNLLLAANSELSADIINTITARGVSEVFIRDWRVTDVLVVPLFSPQNEGILAKAFWRLIMEKQGQPDDGIINEINVAISAMVKDISLNVVGDVNVMCSISPNDYVYLQPVKTAGLCLAIGRGLGLSPEDMVKLGMAAVFKDIGLPLEVMDTVDCLAEGASPALSEHPVAGSNLLQQHKLTGGEIAKAVLHHHEHWFGTGYPQGLKGNAISKFSRIIAISDAFVDLLSVRPGRNKYMPHEAIEYIMACGGDQFDPELVELFVRQVPSYPSGLSVQLNTGDTGIVSDAKLGFVARPIVRICYRPVKGLLKEPINVDLSRQAYQRMLITKVLEYD